ncbi:Glycine-rich RNA-binding protein 5, mitochondrial [Glycine max]|nr:Glycine-rich RNA-binding protein 5, mitochondrial [Glycine max]
MKLWSTNKVCVKSKFWVLPQHTNTFSSMLNYIRCMSSSKLFIGGLSYGVDDQSLKDASSGFGYVVDGYTMQMMDLLDLNLAVAGYCNGGFDGGGYDGDFASRNGGW